MAVLNYGNLVIDHCLFRNNKSLDPLQFPDISSGGAIAKQESNMIIRNSKFINNQAVSAGAISIYLDSDITLENNIFSGNSAIGSLYGQGYGGAAWCIAGSEPNISNNIFSGNHASIGGGVLGVLAHANPVIDHNLFFDNTASWGAAIEVQDTCGPRIINNTIVYNHATYHGAGIDVWDCPACVTEVRNTILWGNTVGGEGPQVWVDYDNTVDIYYSDVMDGESGVGGYGIFYMHDCLNDDPQFEDLINFYLSDGSPCIDAGDPDVAYNDDEDPVNPGSALWPSMGGLRNDMGRWGGHYHLQVGIDAPASNALFDGLLCYPNPATDMVVVSVSSQQSAVSSQVTLKIYDLYGREVKTLVEEMRSPGGYSVRADVSDLPAGVYIVRLQAGNTSTSTKFVVR
jgi:hypothetical protein